MAKITSAVETITPERSMKLLAKAEEYIIKNGFRQRPLKIKNVREFARAMTEGAWQLNGEAIIIDKHGVVKDGQHRLHACVQAQRSFETMVVQGVEPEVFKTIDTGAQRSMGDMLAIVGQKDVNVLGSALAVLSKIERQKGRITAWVGTGFRPTKAELLKLSEQHPDLPDYVAKTGKIRRIMSPGVCAALWYLMAKKDAAGAADFWGKIASGENLSQGDPVYILRERLIKEARKKPRPTADQTAELIVRAWNAVRKGEFPGKLQRGKPDSVDLLIR